jgi:hypothetical protein
MTAPKTTMLTMKLHMSAGLTENVSAAPGIDASATRYSRTKDVHVLPIIITTELKLSNVQRATSPAQSREAAHPANRAGRREGAPRQAQRLTMAEQKPSPPRPANIIA